MMTYDKPKLCFFKIYILYTDLNEFSFTSGLENNICGKAAQRGSFRVDSPYLRIKYVPTRGQYIKDVFSITITAFTDDGKLR
jgi:hypothetical protein